AGSGFLIADGDRARAVNRNLADAVAEGGRAVVGRIKIKVSGDGSDQRSAVRGGGGEVHIHASSVVFLRFLRGISYITQKARKVKRNGASYHGVIGCTAEAHKVPGHLPPARSGREYSSCDNNSAVGRCRIQ